MFIDEIVEQIHEKHLLLQGKELLCLIPLFGTTAAVNLCKHVRSAPMASIDSVHFVITKIKHSANSSLILYERK